MSGLRAGDRVAAWVEGGGFAEQAVVEERYCVAVAAGVTYAAVAEPLACVVNAVELAAPALADDVVIIGAGYMGNLLQLVSALKGPRTITVADIRAGRAGARPLARRDARGRHVARESLADAVREVTDGRGADVTYEVTGTGPGLALAGEVTRMSGKLCIVGYHQGGGRTIPLASGTGWRSTSSTPTSATSTRSCAACAPACGSSTPACWTSSPLVTDSFGLDEIEAAFRTAAAKPEGFVKAVVAPAPRLSR